MGRESMVYFPSIDIGAIERQLLSWRSQYAALGVLMLLPEADKQATPALPVICQRHAIPLCGAIFPQLVYGTGFQ